MVNMEKSPLEHHWQRKRILQSKSHQLIAYEEVNEKIVRKRDAKKITFTDGTELIEFLSCSYLGLDQDTRILSAASNHLDASGINFAVSRTRLRMEDFVILESLLQQIFFGGFTTTFSSLHVAHIGMIPLITSGEMPSFPIKYNGVLNLIDTHAHASLKINRGLMLQFGETRLLDINDANLLEQTLKKTQQENRTPVIFADGICSMGGMTNVITLFQLLEKYDGYAYLDDAHGISVFGQQGCGYVLDKLGFFHPRLILAASLSKGFGTNGGAISVPTKEDDEIIKRFCSTYIFGNPIAFPIVSASIASAELHLSGEILPLQEKLHKNKQLFDQNLSAKTNVINHGTASPVRAIRIGNEERTIDAAIKLRQYGFAVSAAMYPTVEKGQSILRITISSNHEADDIIRLCQCCHDLGITTK